MVEISSLRVNRNADMIDFFSFFFFLLQLPIKVGRGRGMQDPTRVYIWLFFFRLRLWYRARGIFFLVGICMVGVRLAFVLGGWGTGVGWVGYSIGMYKKGGGGWREIGK